MPSPTSASQIPSNPWSTIFLKSYSAKVILIQCPRLSPSQTQPDNYDPTYSNTDGPKLPQEGPNRHVGPCDFGISSTFFLLPVHLPPGSQSLHLPSLSPNTAACLKTQAWWGSDKLMHTLELVDTNLMHCLSHWELIFKRLWPQTDKV